MLVIVFKMERGRQRSSAGGERDSFSILREESGEVIYQMFVWRSKIDLADTRKEVVVVFIPGQTGPTRGANSFQKTIM